MRWRAWIAAALLLPAIAAAQGRGGMGGGRGGRGSMGASRSAPSFPSAKDLEKLNPAALLVDKHKKLSLADSQVAALRTVERNIFERNADLLSRYDSVRRDYKPPSAEARTAADDKAQSVSMTQMRAMQDILEQLIERRRVDVGEALGVVPEARRKQAGELLDKQDQEFLESIPSSRAVPGGGGGRRGRPGS